jgi:hypothetical protein
VNASRALRPGFPLLFIAMLLAFMSRQAHSQSVLSLSSAFSEADKARVPGLGGVWIPGFAPGDRLTISPAGDNFYRFIYTGEGRDSLFEGWCGSVAGLTFLEILPVVPETLGDSDYRQQLVRTHKLYKMTVDKDTLRVAALSYGWFRHAVAAGNAPISYSWTDRSILLTMPTTDLRAFLVRHTQEKGFLEDDFVLNRVPGDRREKPPSLPVRFEGPAVRSDSRPPVKPCLPEFSLKDGWLGGDGDLSVPLDRSRSLWIFSDTFVGRKDQTSRSGCPMVSNTVAIMTCAPNTPLEIEYFWREPRTDSPKPFFESSTSRYRYWPCGAVTVGNVLYIFLTKIGVKPGAAPGDIFNFKAEGMSLAKIQDPGLSRPDQWAIQLIPWSGALDPDSWGCLAVEQGFLYFFLKGADKAVLLEREPLDFIEHPQGRLEYYSDSNVWKVGWDPSDARRMFSGEAGNSVYYHADLKEWVMVCGPDFMRNTIGIRTSPSLTGPWTDEKIVYRCPESTPGSPGYDKDTFCYLGREHIEYYDPATRTILVTYDSNSVDFGKLASSTRLYVPRVLRVSLDNGKERSSLVPKHHQ